VTDQSHNFKDN